MAGGFEICIWLLLVIASITDLLWGKIFNALTFSFLGLGLAAQFWQSGLAGGKEALLGVGAALLLFFPLYLLKAFAAGDVKLLMAVGAWTNAMTVARLGAYAVVVGCLVGGIVLVQQLGLIGSVKSTAEHVKTLQPKASHRMPFAPAFLCGFLVLKVAEMQGWRLF